MSILFGRQWDDTILIKTALDLKGPSWKEKTYSLVQIKAEIFELGKINTSKNGISFLKIKVKDSSESANIIVAGKKLLRILQNCNISDSIIITNLKRPIKHYENRGIDFIIEESRSQILRIKEEEKCVHRNTTTIGDESICSDCGEVFCSPPDSTDPQRGMIYLTSKEYRRVLFDDKHTTDDDYYY